MRKLLTSVLTLVALAAMATTADTDLLRYGTENTWSAYTCYTFAYPSVGADGEPAVLSALLCLPKLDNPSADGGSDGGECYSGVVIACHATIASNKECPSAYPDSDVLIGDGRLMQYYAAAASGLRRKDGNDHAARNIVIMPDYEGYGITRDRPHPYLNESLTARQVVDAVEWGLELLWQGRVELADRRTTELLTSQNHGMRNGWGTVAIGVSQGGAVAMAVQKHIELNALDGTLRFRGAICCDGPYDPLATMRFYMTQTDYHRRNIVKLPVAAAMIIKGMLDSDTLMAGHKLEDYCSPQFIATGIFDMIDAKRADDTEMTITDITQALYDLCRNGNESYSAAEYAQLFPDRGHSLISGYHAYGDLSKMLTEPAYEYFSTLATDASVPQTRGVMEDLHAAMARNNLTSGWTPKHQLCLYHSREDCVVPFDNYTNAYNAFADATTVHSDTTSTAEHVEACRHFFLALGTSPDVRYIRLLSDGSEVDAIDDMRDDLRDGGDPACYDINGRRVASPQPGSLYISNGHLRIAR